MVPNESKSDKEVAVTLGLNKNISKIKKVIETVLETNKVVAPLFDTETSVCCECEEKISENKYSGRYVILFKSAKLMKPICGNCLNVKISSSLIRYSEDMNTYNKRVKVGFYKDWIVE